MIGLSRASQIAFLALTLIANSAIAEEAINLPAEGAFILPTSAGKALLHQCSRETPRDVDEFWQPTSQDIENVEQTVRDFFANPEESPDKDTKNIIVYMQHHYITSFNRQYIGFIKDNQKYIYGNFYPDNVPKIPDNPVDEHFVPIIMCDGGPSFWGIVYGVSTKRIQDIAINGIT